jgi:hypothetical protein
MKKTHEGRENSLAVAEEVVLIITDLDGGAAVLHHEKVSHFIS